MQGTVKWFSNDKGFGFITSVDNQDHYFNVQGVRGSELPSTGDVVEFESFKGHKGPKAKDVVVIGNSRENKKSRDDRVTCSNCERKVVPRLIVYNGEPTKSVCPFCATQISDFRSPSILNKVVIFIVLSVVAFYSYGFLIMYNEGFFS